MWCLAPMVSSPQVLKVLTCTMSDRWRSLDRPFRPRRSALFSLNRSFRPILCNVLVMFSTDLWENLGTCNTLIFIKPIDSQCSWSKENVSLPCTRINSISGDFTYLKIFFLTLGGSCYGQEELYRRQLKAVGLQSFAFCLGVGCL